MKETAASLIEGAKSAMKETAASRIEGAQAKPVVDVAADERNARQRDAGIALEKLVG